MKSKYFKTNRRVEGVKALEARCGVCVRMDDPHRRCLYCHAVHTVSSVGLHTIKHSVEPHDLKGVWFQRVGGLN
jgi:hypothetical protein